jgi:hypothetical protein
MANINLQQSINKLKLGNADKLLLGTIITGLVNDIETLRAANVALCQKLDTAGGSVASLGTNYNATVGVAASKLNVGK